MPTTAAAGSVNGTPAAGAGAASLGEAQLAAILGAVEQQLTRYFTAMSARADAVQSASEAGRSELAAHFQQQIDVLASEVAIAQQSAAGAGSAHEAVVDERIGIAISQMQQRSDRANEVLATRIEELQGAARRLDEQSAAIVAHVNDTTATLSRHLDDTGKALAGHIDERVTAANQTVHEQLGAFGRKIDDTENRLVDRTLAMEERINEQSGVRLAAVEATIGRISGGIDEAIVALSHRVIELENAHAALGERIDAIAARVESVDQEAIDQLREQMSSAIGESMLVRIELERVASSSVEQFDKVNVRMAELANDIAESTLDVGTAVQLERLEEIERALVELNPDQFVRKSDVAGDAPATSTS